MAKPLSKSQIADHLAKSAGLTKAAALGILAELAVLAQGEAPNTFAFPGIGKLALVDRKARTGRNPATGEPVEIPAKKVVVFRVSKTCKDAVLGAEISSLAV